jgi:hypothetical protein
VSDAESDDQLAYRLGVTLGMDFALPITHPIIARLKPGKLPGFLDIPVITDPDIPPDTIVFRTVPPRPDSWVRDRFIEKGHTMPTNEQTQIHLGYQDKLTPAVSEQWPAARNSDPSTSHAAAASVRGAETIRGRVYQILSTHGEGLTHEQIVEAYNTSVTLYGWPPAADQSIRSRTKELERDGFVKRNDKAVDKTAAGRLTHRWYAVTDYTEVQRRRTEGPASKPITVEDVPQHVQQKIITRFLADLEAESQRQADHPRPEAFTSEAVNVMAEDIKAARTSGWFTAIDMAKFLVGRGWR